MLGMDAAKHSSLTTSIFEYTTYEGGHTHNCSYAGTNGNTTNANIPNYKSVYIWERTA
jgi:hypothetical protein